MEGEQKGRSEEIIEEVIKRDLKEIEQDVKEVEHLREELSDLHEAHHNVEVVVDGTPYNVPYTEGTSVKSPKFLRISPSPDNNPATPRVEQAVMFQEDKGEAFMCMAGVREYHNHPAHNGDFWLLHRGTGMGTLFHILDKLHEFGITPLVSLNFALQFQFNGFQYGVR